MHMILVYDITSTIYNIIHIIIVSLYLILYRISMQIRGHDVFAIKLSSFTCYDIVSYYDTTTLISFFIN
jgi:hypothetical protein